mmetsp:Transcript_2983/g.5156  ORF Transcript_2983/g.5156 Transcript_2983/m.5156 type:complete len:286 (-) Transcript_2983:637-1494(-)
MTKSSFCCASMPANRWPLTVFRSSDISGSASWCFAQSAVCICSLLRRWLHSTEHFWASAAARICSRKSSMRSRASLQASPGSSSRDSVAVADVAVTPEFAEIAASSPGTAAGAPAAVPILCPHDFQHSLQYHLPRKSPASPKLPSEVCCLHSSQCLMYGASLAGPPSIFCSSRNASLLPGSKLSTVWKSCRAIWKHPAFTSARPRLKSALTFSGSSSNTFSAMRCAKSVEASLTSVHLRADIAALLQSPTFSLSASLPSAPEQGATSLSSASAPRLKASYAAQYC